ncbi:hypothetical protein J5N97_006465 [Dioscorea zingiberensis]|uniref:Uncharacterized protein n=1 Tax=Dioscorea zingiberensis TaxID=325984 RepID=A0A9D5DAX1_9LILI|nr:hypothetical protein J5N97_006465 [Dioscorea zingiberensis]
MARLSVLSCLFLLFLVNPNPTTSTTSLWNAIDGCPSRCNGAIDIPFPFGIGPPPCALPGFQLSCQPSHPQPLLHNTSLRILNFTNGQLLVDSSPFIAVDCALPHHQHHRKLATISLPPHGPFTISGVSNSFVAVGCDTVAALADGDTFASGCVSLCASKESVLVSRSTPVGVGCSGVGCCEGTIPEGRRLLSVGAGSMFGYGKVSGFNNCSYAFVVERGGYVFDQQHLSMMDFPRRTSISMRLDWAIPRKLSPMTLCGHNSYHVPSPLGPSAYLCNCSHGYSGNPYLNGPHGCQDVDECQNPEANPCVSVARCRNRVPGYKCECPFGSSGDGTRAGSGCKKIFQIVESILATGLGIGVMLLCGLWFYFALKNRALIKLKEYYFRQNGGLLLKQQVSNCEARTRIFSKEELEQATQNYNESRILGTGGYGTVYKGVLEDGTVVAIKKSRVMDRMRTDQFINEVVILTQINHRNVVKLLGCCLETEVPMLVYEFIPNGTLYEHIHEKSTSSLRITWSDRLRIATETAEALTYLHSAASMPVFHRDVKSSNILLGDNLTAKVSDFGISRLVPLDQTQVPTLVQGTFGYLDPEYFQTSQLTSKSDVYSFGVVLVELLTGQKPVSMERPREDSNLAMYFLSSLKCKDLREFIDVDVMREASNVEQLKAAAELARKCLLLRGDKRPSMKEVAQELLLIASFGRHDCGDDYDEVEEQLEFDKLPTCNESSSSAILCPGESSSRSVCHP